MYTVELSGSLILIIHGVLLMALLDHIKSLKMLRAVNKITKGLIVIYGLMVLARIVMYIHVHTHVSELDIKNLDQGFGNFLASYIADNSQAATWITLILISVFALCFIVNILTIKISKQLEEFVIRTESNTNNIIV